MSTDFRSTPIAEALHVEEWGDGTPVVLVHGSLATAQEEWEAQRPLVDEGFHFLAPDRRGDGRSPAAVGEDFLQDGQDIAELMGDAPTGRPLLRRRGRARAASLRPEATLSLTLLEPGTFALGQDHPAGRAFGEGARAVWDDEDADDLDWVVAFLKAVGSNPDEFPPEFLKAALPLVPVVRRARSVWTPDLPLAASARAPFQKLVVSGGHSAGFDAICDDLAVRIGATRAVAEGAGHEVQFAAPTVNDLLLDLWRSVV